MSISPSPRVSTRLHIVGHDTGGMIARTYASRYPDRVASIIWGECPLSGTKAYASSKAMPTVQRQFHFVFHSVPDLPEALVTGREKIYLEHFYDKLALNTGAIAPADLNYYALMYSQPGELRCAFAVYAAFDADAKENLQYLEEQKYKVPALAFSGDSSAHAAEVEEAVREMCENVEVAVVEESGHYLAEENPKDFAGKVLAFAWMSFATIWKPNLAF